MTNKETIELVDKFKSTGSSFIFEELWASTVMMVNPYKYFDPTGARDEEDFEQITRIGLYKAIETFEEGRGSTILTWIRMRMHQMLIKEVRKMVRESRLGQKISFDTAYAGMNMDYEDQSGAVEKMIYHQMKSSGESQNDFKEELYWQIFADVETKVSRNRALAKVFYFKMAFPRASRTLIAQTFGLSRPCLSTYFSTIKTCITLASEKYAV
tara:strand:+ start:951 stop:1586 length:636 start_codon:yes stop_codon:yes gene_type:complete